MAQRLDFPRRFVLAQVRCADIIVSGGYSPAFATHGGKGPARGEPAREGQSSDTEPGCLAAEALNRRAEFAIYITFD